MTTLKSGSAQACLILLLVISVLSVAVPPPHPVVKTVWADSSGQVYGLGWIPEAKPKLLMQTAVTVALPSHFDWRSYNGSNWMTPVKNQGGCGSCVAFGAVGVEEAQYRIDSRNPSWNLDLSEQHLFSCGGGSCSAGWVLSGALNYLRDYGTPDEGCYPYQSGGGTDRPCSATCPNWQSRTYKISTWSWIGPGPAQIENALMHGPVLTAFTVYYDFFNFFASNPDAVYHWDQVSGVAGGHAVAIVGYDIPGQYWIVKNSWGTSWGNNGYFKIGFGEGGIDGWATTLSTAPSISTTFYTNLSTAQINANGIWQSNGTSQKYYPGQRVHIIGNVPAGYHFTQWATSGVTVDSQTSPDTYVTISGTGWVKNQVAANPLPVLVSYSTDPAGYGLVVDNLTTSTPATASYAQGQVVHIVASPPANYNFAGWTTNTLVIDSTSSADTHFTAVSTGTIVAHYSPITYTVTFYTDPTGGTITANDVTKTNGQTGSYATGTNLHLTASPPTGYQFTQWETSQVTVESATLPDTHGVVAGNGYVKAHFSAIPPADFAVTFNTDPTSGTLTADSVTETDGSTGTYTSGQRIHVVANTLVGYSFASWEPRGGVTIDSQVAPDTYLTVSGDGGLTARFAPVASQQYTVTFHTDPAAGTITADNNTEQNGATATYTVGQRVHITANPPSGYLFTGWDVIGVSVDNALSADTYMVGSADGELTAHFAPQPYSYTCSVSGLNPAVTTYSYLDGTLPQPLSDGGSYTYTGLTGQHTISVDPYATAGAPTGTRYHATNYSTTISASGTTTFTYRPEYQLTLQANPSNGGTTTPSAGSYWYDSGASVSVSASPSGNYLFSSWSDDGTQSHSVTVAQAGTLTANFALPAYSYSCSATGLASGVKVALGLASGAKTTCYLDGGSPQTLSNGGSYTYTGLTGQHTVSVDQYTTNGAPSGTRYHATNYSAQVSAGGSTAFIYHTEYQWGFAVSPSGSGTTSPSVGTYWYDTGTSTTVSATPSTNYAFSSWSDKGAQTHKVTFTAPGSLTATFTPTAYVVTFNTDPTSGTITAGGVVKANGATATYSLNQKVTVTATPPAGYQFGTWSTSGVSVASTTAQTTTLTASNNGWIKATFTKTPIVTVAAQTTTGTAIRGVAISIDNRAYSTPTTLGLSGTHTFAAPASTPVGGIQYAFVAWKNANGATLTTGRSLNYNIVADTTLYASYALPSYSITLTVIAPALKGNGYVIISGATVVIDGMTVGTTNSLGRLTATAYAGSHTIQILKAGYALYTTTIMLNSNTALTVTLRKS